MKGSRRLAISVIGVFLSLSLSIFAGGNSDNSSSKKTKTPSEKKVTIRVVGEQGSLDPALNISLTYWHYSPLVTAPLVEKNEDGTNHWIAATSCDINKDLTQYTFHLSKELKWSDGSDCTAQDFINTITRSLNPKSGNGYASFLYIIKNAKEFRDGKVDANSIGVEAVDSKTLRFTLNQSCAYFLDLMPLPVFMATPSKVATAINGDWAMDPKTALANGPFYMSERVSGQYIVVKKNPYYVQADQIKLDSVVEKFIPDPQAAINALKTGEVDFTSGDGAPNTLEEFTGKPELKVMPAMNTYYALLNWNAKPFNDVRVREALTLALNRVDMTRALGKSFEVTTNFVTKNMTSALGKAWGTETPPLFTEDIAKAQDLLAKAGYPNGQGLPSLTYKFPTRAQDQETGEILQAQWKKNLGIDIKLESQEQQVNISDRRSGNFSICRMAWTADYCEPSTYLNMYISGSSYNDSKISIPEYDKLIAVASLEVDPRKRNALYHQAESELISKNFALIPLYSTRAVFLLNPRITKFVIDPARNGFRYQYFDVK